MSKASQLSTIQTPNITKKLGSALQQKFKDIISAADVLKHGELYHQSKDLQLPYGGLIRPKRIQNVKVQNRGMISSEMLSGKTSKEDKKESVFGRRGGSHQVTQQNNTEQDEETLK